MQPFFDEQIEGPKDSELNPEDKRNLVGFFALLVKVDKRINPHLYKSNNHNL